LAKALGPRFHGDERTRVQPRRALQKLLALVRAEIDRLDAGLALPVALGGDDGGVLGIEAFEPGRRVA
jgi:hypothetical protein